MMEDFRRDGPPCWRSCPKIPHCKKAARVQSFRPDRMLSRTQAATIQPWAMVTTAMILMSVLCMSRSFATASAVDRGAAEENRTTTEEPSSSMTPTVYIANLAVDDPEVETSASLKILFILLVLVACIFLVLMMYRMKIRAIPESVAVIGLGATIGVAMKFLGDFEKVETFDVTFFYLFLLPPVIFESGFSLHKGYFFTNFGSIVTYAVFGTIISAIVVAGGVYYFGQLGWVYEFTAVESMIFGSLISAVDPVATLAIFQAMKVDQTLNMLVFGESVLNDAVSIVLTRTMLMVGGQAEFSARIIRSIGVDFFLSSVGSALIGVSVGLVASLVFKFMGLWRVPSLEFAMLVIFAYLPYAIAEGLNLSGIMAILFSSIVMSHYAHFNLSAKTRGAADLSFRSISFLAENCVFIYLGLAIVVYDIQIKMPFLLLSILLILLGRGLNIVPLSAIINQFRTVKITAKMQFCMWFSGLRGAIAFALVLSLPIDMFSTETRGVLISTTLMIVLFTIVILGCSTLPVIHHLQPGAEEPDLGKANRVISKSSSHAQDDMSFAKLDRQYLTPLFRRDASAPRDWERAQYEANEQSENNMSDASAPDGAESDSPP